MQLIVQGMHRSGTSAVARLLNMMGAYFAPPEQMMPPTDANPKGYWEREDVRWLNERIFTALNMSWDNIADFKSSALTEEICAPFREEARKIVFSLDANRPWLLKDPRLCLLLPFWQEFLEIPVCVYVYRNPIQVAQSLQKTRPDFSLSLGLALWEKYTAFGLDTSHAMPRIFISHESLLATPVATTQALYQALLDHDVRGLHLPTAREIEAFIDPALFHARGDSALQEGFANPRQLALFYALKHGTVDTTTCYGEGLSPGAHETLAAHQDKLRAAEAAAHLYQEVEKNKQLVARYEGDMAQVRGRVLDLQEAVDKKEQDVRKLHSEIDRLRDQAEAAQQQHEQLHDQLRQTQNETQNQLQAKTSALEQLETRVQQQDKNTHRLLSWLAALEEDVNAVFRSFTWKIGNTLTRWILRLTLRKPGLTAQHHLAAMFAEIEAWKSQHARVFQAAQHGQARNASVARNAGVAVAAQAHDNRQSPEWYQEPTASASAAPPSAPPVVRAPHNPRDYAAWVKKYDTPNDKLLKKMRARIATWNNPPLVSIVMPTYNTEEKWLREAIDSVREQVYPNWQLCIADDASPAPHVRKVLQEYSAKDKRIRVCFREENGHISLASNSALELAEGELTAFLDHDDRLHPHALFWVVKTYYDYPKMKLWYSDEDKITENGERYEPYFKSDWNPDLLLSHNLVTHLAVYRTDLLREIGGLRQGFEGAQDYDLVLRMATKLHAHEVFHIPRVLYHWRAVAGSTAHRGDEKPYAIIAARNAIGEYLAQRGAADALITESPEVMGAIRVQYQLCAPPPLVSLIIPTRNCRDLLHTCVESILATTEYSHYEILVVDNESDDPATLAYFEELEQRGAARIIPYPHPFNYADMNNQAADHARGEVLGFLNNDLEVINRGWLTEMVSHVMRSEIGAVGARLWYPDNTLQHGGVILGIGGVAGHSHKGWPKGDVGYFGRAALVQNFCAVTGACMVVRKENFVRLQGFDAENLKVAFNDVDFCLRLHEHGFRNLWTPYAELYHHESASRGYEDTPEKIARFEKERQYMKKRWANFLLMDPAYSPNLTLETQDFAYSWPPRVSPEP